MYFRKGDEKMKKSKLSLGLVTSFIGALALTSCSTTPTVTSSKKSIVDFIGYNGKDDKIEINIDKFYSEYGDSDESTTLFYNAVLESLIRFEYKGLSDKDDTLKKYSTLVAEANEKVNAQKQVATDNAKSNGTKYEEEWDKILESYDCKTTTDLKEHFLYELEKEAINEWYFKSNQDELQNQYIGVTEDWKPITKKTDTDGNLTHEDESVFPYHILHVLVKLGASASDYARATITSAEAEKLWRVVRKLMDGSYSFEDVAYQESEDSSNTAYGDVGIMSTQTSFYNEFKLGVYAYDALLSGVNSQDADNKVIYEALGVDEDATVVTEVKNNGGVKEEVRESVDDLVDENMVENVQNAVTGYDGSNKYTDIPTIPYDVFRQLNEVKNEEKINSKEIKAGQAAYPRNVLFNQFLNFRSPFVITNEDIEIDSSNAKVATSIHDFSDTSAGNFFIKNNNFSDTALANLPQLAGKSVLTDGNENVIICVRSEAGIHFMVMRKSVFKATNVKANKDSVTLQQYYTTEVPETGAGYPGEDYPAQTYVNMSKKDDPSYYTNRANTIKNKLKGQDPSDAFDAAYDYRIYEMLLNNEQVAGKLKFFDESEGKSVIAQNILKKIQLLREGKAISNADSIEEAWQKYLAQLRHQNTIRSYDNAILSTSCIYKWNHGEIDDFDEGGSCYVK